MANSRFGVTKGLEVRDPVDPTKSLYIDLSGSATTGTTTTLTASQTANRTLALPDSSGTLMTGSSSDTLTGKTIDGDDNTLLDISLASLKTVLADASKFLVRDASGIVVSNTKAVPAGTVVGTSDAQVLTAKDYDGGTASNTSRFTIPKNTTGNLTALTRKQGTFVYDTTLSAPFYDDGTTLQPLTTGGAANTALSNLSAVAVNTSLLPGSDGSINLGSQSFRWQNAHIRDSVFVYGSGTNIPIFLSNTVTITPSGNSVNASITSSGQQTFGIFSPNQTGTSNSSNVYFETGNNSNAVSGNTGSVNISSGSSTNVGSSGSSGNVNISSGGVSGGSGTSGNINLTTSAAIGGRGSINLAATKVRRQDAAVNQFIEEQYYDGVALSGSQTNATISDFTFAHATYDSIFIDYKVKEATSNDVRIGRLMVCTDGTNTSISDVGTETASTGITFSAVVSGANVLVRYSSGANAATMRADVKRIRT